MRIRETIYEAAYNGTRYEIRKDAEAFGSLYRLPQGADAHDPWAWKFVVYGVIDRLRDIIAHEITLTVIASAPGDQRAYLLAKRALSGELPWIVKRDTDDGANECEVSR